MRMQGKIQDAKIIMLIDSGSSHTFISEKLATQFSRILPLTSPIGVQVANGSKLAYASYITEGIWHMRGYQFKLEMSTLPLHSYDMIIGMEWLENHGPMKVHWNKWMLIPYKGSQVFLEGIIDEAPCLTKTRPQDLLVAQEPIQIC
jgi:hypothetical protein